MSRLRVAIDVTALLGPPTGINQVTTGLIRALTLRDDVDVHGWLLSARGNRPPLPDRVYRSRLPARLAQRTWAWSSFPPGRLIAGSADVIHGTNFLAPPSPGSVISLQDLTPVSHPEWCEPAVAAMAGPVHRAASRGATFHVSSAVVRDEAIEVLKLAPERVHLVHHAVTPVSGGDPATGRALAGADRYFVVLGTVERRKNVGAAVAAMGDLPSDIRLVIAGPAGNAQPEVDAAIARLEPGRVTRLPTLDTISRNSLLRGALGLLWPSRYEGFALPPLEALSVGTPVVATAVGALPELVGDVIELVPAGDDVAFVDATNRLVASSRKVPDTVVERIAAMTWESAARAMVDVYRTAHRA